jgi:hypothetical protein
MLPDRQERLAATSRPVEDEIDDLNRSRGVKIGDTSEFFFAAQEDLLRARAGNVGFTMTAKGSAVVPGDVLCFMLDKSKVDFEDVDGRVTFNPLGSRLSSNATTPYPVFVQKIFNQDIEELAGVMRELESLAGLV